MARATQDFKQQRHSLYPSLLSVICRCEPNLRLDTQHTLSADPLKTLLQRTDSEQALRWWLDKVVANALLHTTVTLHSPCLEKGLAPP